MVFACSATIFKMCWIVKRAKQRRIAVNVDKVVRANIACSQGQKARRADVSPVRDEHDAMAVANAEAAS